MIPPRENEFIFNKPVEDVGENYKIKWNKDKIIRTPSGQFNNWISLVSSRIEKYDSVIVVPRIGIVFRLTQFKNFSGQVTNVYKSELVNYKIN